MLNFFVSYKNVVGYISLEEELEEVIWKQLIYLWQIHFWPVIALLLASASDWNRAMKTEPSRIDDRTCYSVNIFASANTWQHTFSLFIFIVSQPIWQSVIFKFEVCVKLFTGRFYLFFKLLSFKDYLLKY